MLAIKPLACSTRDEELTAIAVHTAVGHRQQPGACVSESERLVFERQRLVDGGHTRTVAVNEVTSLQPIDTEETRQIKLVQVEAVCTLLTYLSSVWCV